MRRSRGAPRAAGLALAALARRGPRDQQALRDFRRGPRLAPQARARAFWRWHAGACPPRAPAPRRPGPRGAAALNWTRAERLQRDGKQLRPGLPARPPRGEGPMTTDRQSSDAIAAIRGGDVATLQRLLADDPGLAAARLGGIAKGRTPLHVVADWPGYFPNGPRIVRMLIDAGADPNARDPDQPSSETPLHWAASSDDADVAAALIDGGADVEVPRGSIGTPLDNAIGYAC